jgi:sugar lactone lactonase YvrE
MKKKFTVLFFMVLLVSTFAFSQERPESNWEFSKVLIDSMAPHGVVVTPDDNIWMVAFGRGQDVEILAGSIIVFNPDLTVKAKINEAVINGVVHNLNDDADRNFGAGRGLSLGHDGKVYSSHWNALCKWNYETMEALDYLYILGAVQSNALSSAAVDAEGNIILTNVYCNVNGVRMFMEGGIFIGFAIEAGHPQLPGASRSLAMTADGKNLFIANTDVAFANQPSLQHWYSELGAWGEYTPKQTIGDYGMTCEDIYLDKLGRLWIGVNGDPAEGRYSRYDCWDLEKMEIVDVLVSPFVWGNQVGPYDEFDKGAFGMPRGFCLSNDGTKAYVSDYNNGIHEYKRKDQGPSSTNEPKSIPETFTLSQNYPNPFNPSTKFSYSLPNASDVKIVIYDVFGREVKTLVNDINKAAGTYNVTWNGKDNNNRQAVSGVYFYNMQAAGFNKTMKMILMK